MRVSHVPTSESCRTDTRSLKNLAKSKGAGIGGQLPTVDEPSEIHYLDELRMAVDVMGTESAGRMSITAGLRSPHAVRAGVIGLFLQNTCGRIAVGEGVAVVTEIDLSIFDPALDVQEIRSYGRLVKGGWSAVVVEGWVYSGHPERTLSHAISRWAPVAHPRSDDQHNAAQVNNEVNQTYADDILELIGIEGPQEEPSFESAPRHFPSRRGNHSVAWWRPSDDGGRSRL